MCVYLYETQYVTRVNSEHIPSVVADPGVAKADTRPPPPLPPGITLLDLPLYQISMKIVLPSLRRQCAISSFIFVEAYLGIWFNHSNYVYLRVEPSK
jgi:hypothetical protein